MATVLFVAMLIGRGFRRPQRPVAELRVKLPGITVNRMTLRAARWMFVLSVVLLLCRACVPVERVTGADLQIHLMAPWGRSILGWGSLAGLLLAILAGIIARRGQRRPLGLFFVLSGLCLFMGSWCCFGMMNLAPWIQYNSLTHEGQVYSYYESSFLQGQTLALTRLKHDGFLERTEDVLGTNNGDSPRSWASVIRPAGASDNAYGEVYLTESGWLLGFRYEEHCFLAYHIPTGKFLGHDDVETLSPFLLLADGHAPHANDAKRILKRMQAPEPKMGTPQLRVLQEGLTSSSPVIRELAAKFLSATSKPAGTTGEAN